MTNPGAWMWRSEGHRGVYKAMEEKAEQAWGGGVVQELGNMDNQKTVSN